MLHGAERAVSHATAGEVHFELLSIYEHIAGQAFVAQINAACNGQTKASAVQSEEEGILAVRRRSLNEQQ